MSTIPTNQGPVIPNHVAESAPPGTTYCKGCGRQFVRKEGINPASAQFHRCDDCNHQRNKDLYCHHATCGASSLCTIQ